MTQELSEKRRKVAALAAAVAASVSALASVVPLLVVRGHVRVGWMWLSLGVSVGIVVWAIVMFAQLRRKEG